MHFTLPVAAAALSEYVLNACGRGRDEDDEEEPEPEEYKPVDVLRVSGQALEKVVFFLTHHHREPMKEIPTPLGANTFNEVSPLCGCWLVVVVVVVIVGLSISWVRVVVFRHCLTSDGLFLPVHLVF
jgi:hypothetical protein